MKSKFVRRLSAAVIVPTLTFGTLAAVAPSAQANTAQARSGAVWLADQLTDGLLHNPNYGGFDDYGLSADALLALASVGGFGAEVKQISNALAANIGSYVGDGTVEAYSGSTAKLLVAAAAADKEVTSFGGVNLVTRLEGLVTSGGAGDGRIADTSAYGDYANSFGQAYATQGLEGAASSTKTAAVTSYLLQQQCAAGYFRLNFNDEATNAAQTCDGGDPATASAPDTDATALALKALLPQAGNPSIDAAIGDATDWLLTSQKSDGSFGGGTSTEAANANSTGLAGSALGLAGKDTAAGKSAAWLFGYQASPLSACGTQLTNSYGAVAYNQGAWETGRSTGITDDSSDQWRRATTQAVPALVNYEPPAALPSAPLAVTGPTTYVAGGSTVAGQTSGLVPGEFYCVSGIGTIAGGLADSSGNASYQVVVPAGTANQVITFTGSRSTRTGSATFGVLGAKKLSPKVKHSSLKKNKKQKISITGLAPFEPVGVGYRGKRIKSAVASATGSYTYSFKVGKAKGKKTVSVVGLFSDRRGTKTFKVK